MPAAERRTHIRVKIYYPISYVCTDEKDHVVQDNMGVALNISQSGILIKTTDGVFSKFITLRTIDLNKNIMEIKGKVAYCKKDKSGKYLSGISFAENHAINIYFVKRLIRAYFYNKDEHRNRPAQSSRSLLCCKYKVKPA
jgi:hypothetical protein